MSLSCQPSEPLWTSYQPEIRRKGGDWVSRGNVHSLSSQRALWTSHHSDKLRKKRPSCLQQAVSPVATGVEGKVWEARGPKHCIVCYVQQGCV